MDDSLAELQILLMEQQRSMETMSEQLAALSQKLMGLEKKTTLLESRIGQFMELAAQGHVETDEQPPHY